LEVGGTRKGKKEIKRRENPKKPCTGKALNYPNLLNSRKEKLKGKKRGMIEKRKITNESGSSQTRRGGTYAEERNGRLHQFDRGSDCRKGPN